MPGKVKSIVICGVGGQGILLTSTVLAESILLSGFDVKKAEVHGMAQRGGSVISQLRYGTKVYSPLIPKGTASMIISFEKMEVLRYIDLLHTQHGIVIINDYEIPPAGVLLGKEKYPKNIKEFLEGKVNQIILLDAFKIATDIGNFRITNMVMLGVAANFLEIPPAHIMTAIKNHVHSRFQEYNVKAFNAGLEIGKSKKLLNCSKVEENM